MMDSGVVVIRTKHEKYDIIGFVAKVTDSYILLENPHFAIMSKESFNVSPYCPIADSLQFQFFLDDIIFLDAVVMLALSLLREFSLSKLLLQHHCSNSLIS